MTRLTRKERLKRMELAARAFYEAAQEVGCHTFLEHAGLLNEFIKIAYRTDDIDQQLTPYDFEKAYILEKLSCMYGKAFEQ